MLLSIGGVALAAEQTLTLESKDPGDWSNEESQVDHGTLTYNDLAPTFDYNLMLYGMTDADYSMIYYADPWPGSGSILITDVTVTDGDAQVSGSVATGSLVDAKIWIVLADDYSDGMVAWSPLSYLFENNLITYTEGAIPTPPVPQAELPDQFDGSYGQFVVGSFNSWSTYDWVNPTANPQVLNEDIDYTWTAGSKTYNIQIPAGTEVTIPYWHDVSSLLYDDGKFAPSYMNFSQLVTFNKDGTVIKFTSIVGGLPQ